MPLPKRKKRSLIRNGVEHVTIQTRHGCFCFTRPRFRDQAGQEVRLLAATTSEPLRRCLLFWVNRLSFGEVACLIEQIAGQELLSEDAIWRLVQREAQSLDAAQGRKIAQSLPLSEPVSEPVYVAPAVEAVYDAASVEFVTMTDGIGVKAQKPTREKTLREKGGTARQNPVPTKLPKRHDTDVLILPRLDGSEEVICEGVSGQWSLVEAAQAFLRREWTGSTLSVVALTDGAKSIRSDLSALFGEGVRVILDWYHLAKRVYQNLSMAAHSMKEREVWEKQVLGLLWRGKTAKARAFLSGLTVRNGRAMADLLGYLDKHAQEIIDYERRQQAGKPIGSGRMEKCVDQVVGHRQKGKGMSWTQAGNRALALLKAAELNARPRIVRPA